MGEQKNASDESRKQAETHLQESQQTIKALMDENKKMKSVVDAQQKEIEMVLAASQQGQKEKEKCIADKETLTKERDVVKKAHAELVKQLDIWTQEFEVVSELQAAGDKQAAELYRQLNCCKEELTRCQRELVQATSEKHTAKNELSAEIDALRPRLVMMEEHTYSMVQSLGDTETRLAASKVEIGEKEKRIRELTMELDTLRGLMEEQNKSLGEARALALSRLEKSEQTVLMKEDCIKTLMDEKKEMNSLVVSLQGECEMELAMSKQDNMEKEKRIRELTVELENSRRLEASGQDIIMKENCIKALMDEVKEIKSVVDARQKECEMVLAISQQDKMVKEKRIKELTVELEALRQEMDNVVKHKISELESLKAELEASNAEVQVVKKEHAESQRACMDTRKMSEDKEAIHTKVCHEAFSHNSLVGSLNFAHYAGFLALCFFKS